MHFPQVSINGVHSFTRTRRIRHWVLPLNKGAAQTNPGTLAAFNNAVVPQGVIFSLFIFGEVEELTSEQLVRPCNRRDLDRQRSPDQSQVKTISPKT